MKNLKLLSKIALSFQNTNGFNNKMENTLKDIGNFMDVSRVYIYFYENKGILKNTFEWCNKGIVPKIQKLKDVEFERILSWNNVFNEDGYICIEDIAELPQDIIKNLESYNVKSLIVYPLIIKGEIKGFIGVEESKKKRKWESQEIELFNTVSGMIANTYEKNFFRKDTITSENNFRNFFETIDDIFIVSDLKGKIIHFNQSLVDKSEYSSEELKNMSISDLYPEDKKERSSKILNELLKGDSEFCSLEVKSKNGTIYLVETRLWLGKWNRQDCIFSISKDVTKENENLELFSKIFEENPLPMAITNKVERKFTKINTEFTEVLGYSEEEVIGKTIEELDIFIDYEKFNEASEELRKQGKIKNKEYIIKHKNGQLLNMMFSIESINNQGKKSYLIAIGDITERVKLTKDIHKKCEKFTNIIEGTDLATWEWNVQTEDVEFNEQWARIIGYTLEEIEPTSIKMWENFVHPDDLRKSDEALERHLNNEEKHYNCEVRMKHKDGRWIWIHDRGKVIEIDSDGNALKMFGTHLDITVRKKSEESLRESEKRFFLALDAAKAGLWDMNMNNDEVFLSPMWKEIIGYSDDEIDNTFEAWRSLWHPDDEKTIQKSIDDYMEHKSSNYENVHRLKHKDGSWRWILSRGGVLRDEEGLPYRWIGTNTDITEEQEQSLELERIFTVNLDLLCVLDMKGNLIKTNEAWDDILGYSSKDLKNQNIIEFIYKDDIPITEQAMKLLKKGEKVDSFVNRYNDTDGKCHYLEWRANPYEGMVYAAARDITERVEYERKILEISNRDALTNVYNRRYVFNRGEEMIKEYRLGEKIFSLCILDIDYFKKVNDNYGHLTGDCVLKEFTKTINENLRLNDILGRYGGEEFIVILDDTDKEESSLIIERILDVVRNKTFMCNENEIKFTFSAGISSHIEIKDNDITIDNLVDLADQKMYEAKNSGRNRIVF